MKLSQHANKLDTNIKVVSQDFGIGNASVIIEILRNRMYEHPIRTLVQEYICNGRDAMREIKSKDKLQVTIPNDVSPVFKVRDFGPGISPERMSKVFILYGASTKRNTNTQTGGFGIGAKSAWSYTDSFTIVTHIDGVQRTYVAHTGVNNQGRLDLITESETDQPNGTEIQVAVKPNDCRAFRNAVFRAVYLWNDAETPIIKGITAMDGFNRHKPTLSVSDGLEIVRDSLPDFLGINSYCELFLNVDGVLYPIERDMYQGGYGKQGLSGVSELMEMIHGKLIVKVANGVVDVAASRESVSNSEQTKQGLEAIAKDALVKLTRLIKDKFAVCKSFSQWADVYRELSKTLNVEEHAKFGKYSIKQNSIVHDDFAKVIIRRCLTTGRANHKVDIRETNSVFLNSFDSVFVEETKETNRAKVHGRIRDYVNSNKDKTLYIMEARRALTDEEKKAGVKEVCTVVESEKALAKLTKEFGARDLLTLPYTPPVRVPREKRDRDAEAVTIHMTSGFGKSPQSLLVKQIAEKDYDYLYVSFDEFDSLKDKIQKSNSIAEAEGYRICAITAKTLKAVEHTKKFTDFKAWQKDFTPSAQLIAQVKSTLAKNGEVINMLKRATIRIKNEKVRAMMKEYESLKPNKALDEESKAWLKKYAAEFEADDTELSKLFKDKYPLIDQTLHRMYGVNAKLADEFVTYMNAKE